MKMQFLLLIQKKQIICEKLKSLLRFGIRTTRYKDIFDIYYLINNTDINKDELLNIIDTLILKNSTMKENNVGDIIKNINFTLNNNIFKRSLRDARNNWPAIPVEEVINNVIDYLKFLETVKI